MAEPVVWYEITDHAGFEIKRRRIDENAVHDVLSAPEQRHAVRTGRHVLQSRLKLGGKTYLLRVFVDVDREPAEVVTVYLTSRVEKYWRS
jgi:hypothetical protein